MLARRLVCCYICALSLLTITPIMARAPMLEPPQFSVSELQKLLPSLQSGGYVIYLRHMGTDHQREDKRPVDLSDCKTQRPLSHQGKQQAKTIGKVFRQLNIPVDKILSSPFCRCKDTARYAFGKFTISNDLYFAMGLNREAKKSKGQALLNIISQASSKNKNTIVVSHTANLQEALGFWPKPEGVAYIFKPDGKGDFEAIARVHPAIWAKLNKSL